MTWCTLPGAVTPALIQPATGTAASAMITWMPVSRNSTRGAHALGRRLGDLEHVAELLGDELGRVLLALVGLGDAVQDRLDGVGRLAVEAGCELRAQGVVVVAHRPAGAGHLQPPLLRIQAMASKSPAISSRSSARRSRCRSTASEDRPDDQAAVGSEAGDVVTHATARACRR